MDALIIDNMIMEISHYKNRSRQMTENVTKAVQHTRGLVDPCTVPLLRCIPVSPLHISRRGDAYFYGPVKVKQIVKLIYILAGHEVHIKAENLPLR